MLRDRLSHLRTPYLRHFVYRPHVAGPVRMWATGADSTDVHLAGGTCLKVWLLQCHQHKVSMFEELHWFRICQGPASTPPM